MRVEGLDPELVRHLGDVPALDLGDIAATRALVSEPAPTPAADGVVVTDVVAEVGGHSVGVRVTKPSQTAGRPLPIVVEMHGGGFVLGSASANDDTNRTMAAELPCIVVAVDYRLSPEFPYPAAIVDCVAAVRWAADSAERWGGEPGRIGVLGTSAGACLAACTALRLRDEGGPTLAMQALIEPALDDRADTPSMIHGADAVFWNSRNALLSWQHYLAGHTPDEYTTPSRRTDLSGLPPTYLTVNELDPLRDQGIDYARRLLAAGVHLELHCWPGAFHGFRMFDTDLTRRTRATDLAAIRRLMGT
ncbi:alpha/beta hydrolase [Rhodococcus opacus]|uniref:alpha/beta hydrolase n=1 Tax=Rhodococcus opacus TaxID=37919 RepID=UPI002235CA61|nr:alpha/beta hydrolase [Rhodococcus opacus]UZG60184.1 alpha/beta hydrolase [Rhodococcus opacus]